LYNKIKDTKENDVEIISVRNRSNRDIISNLNNLLALMIVAGNQTKSDVEQRDIHSLIHPTYNWNDRISTSITPTTSFCYEVTFADQSSLGMNLKHYPIYYTSGVCGRALNCLVVTDSSVTNSSVIQSGDILLRLNGAPLSSEKGSFNFEAMTKLITSTSPPRNIRFFRPQSLSSLAPIEVLLMDDEKTPLMAKFIAHGTSPILFQLSSFDSKVRIFFILFFITFCLNNKFVSFYSYVRGN